VLRRSDAHRAEELIQMAQTKTISDAVSDFINTFNVLQGPMFADLIEAKGIEDRYDNDVLTLVAAPRKRCEECDGTDVENRTVLFDATDEILRGDDDMPFESVEEFETWNEAQDDSAKGDYSYEENKYTCAGCGHVHEDEPPMAEPEYAFPVAWNAMFHTDRFTSKSFATLAAEAGFFVFESEYYQGYILGVDGGGYSFKDDHFTPLYNALGLKWHDEEQPAKAE
jgi:hypothetical protein